MHANPTLAQGIRNTSQEVHRPELPRQGTTTAMAGAFRITGIDDFVATIQRSSPAWCSDPRCASRRPPQPGLPRATECLGPHRPAGVDDWGRAVCPPTDTPDPRQSRAARGLRWTELAEVTSRGRPTTSCSGLTAATSSTWQAGAALGSNPRCAPRTVRLQLARTPETGFALDVNSGGPTVGRSPTRPTESLGRNRPAHRHRHRKGRTQPRTPQRSGQRVRGLGVDQGEGWRGFAATGARPHRQPTWPCGPALRLRRTQPDCSGRRVPGRWATADGFPRWKAVTGAG